MFKGGSDDEAACTRRHGGTLTGIGKSTRKESAPALMALSTAHPDFSAAVPVGTYKAMSIQEYARVDSARTEFLNFLLAPSRGGVPATGLAVDQAA